MSLRVPLTAALTATAALSACNNPDCILIARYAVGANITDSTTGAPLGYRASLIIRDGAYVDSVSSSNASADSADSARTYHLSAGLEREGVYHVTVRREGSRVGREPMYACREKTGAGASSRPKSPFDCSQPSDGIVLYSLVLANEPSRLLEQRA